MDLDDFMAHEIECANAWPTLTAAQKNHLLCLAGVQRPWLLEKSEWMDLPRVIQHAIVVQWE